jgi:hypothetical protein
MSKRILYEKRGRRYYPVQEYDPIVMDAMPAGAHLVVVEPGHESVRYNVNPDHASLLAAFQECRDELAAILQRENQFRPVTRTASQKEMAAQKAWYKVMGNEGPLVLQSSSIHEMLDALERRLIIAVTKGR